MHMFRRIPVRLTGLSAVFSGIQDIAGLNHPVGQRLIPADKRHRVLAQVVCRRRFYAGRIVRHGDLFPGVHLDRPLCAVFIFIGRHSVALQHDQLGEIAGIVRRKRSVQKLPEGRVGFEQLPVCFLRRSVV